MGKFELYRLEQPMPLEAPAGMPPGWGFSFCGWWFLRGALIGPALPCRMSAYDENKRC